MDTHTKPFSFFRTAADGTCGGNAVTPAGSYTDPVGGGWLSQREQSLPGVCGHGLHGAPALQYVPSPGRQRFGVVAVSCGPAMQHAPRAMLGMGMRAHSDPRGWVPSVTNVPARNAPQTTRGVLSLSSCSS